MGAHEAGRWRVGHRCTRIGGGRCPVPLPTLANDKDEDISPVISNRIFRFRFSVLDGNQVQACALVISTARHYCLFLVMAVLGYGVARERPFYCKKELNNGLFATFSEKNLDITKSNSTFAMCLQEKHTTLTTSTTTTMETSLLYTTKEINANFRIKVAGIDANGKKINTLMGVSGVLALIGAELLNKFVARSFKNNNADATYCKLRRGLKVTFYNK